MPFLGHIEELRHRILVIAVTVALAAVVMYPFTVSILDWLFGPLKPFLADNKLYTLSPFEAFLFRFRVGMYSGAVLTSPIWVYQILAFFLPALEPKERKWFNPTFIAIVVLFIGGNLFCHRYILGPSFGWLIGQASGGMDVGQLLDSWFNLKGGGASATLTLETLPNAGPFLNGVLILMLAFGLTFELPVLLFFLMATGLLKYSTLRRNWRYAYLIMIIFGTLATPDWSPVTIGGLIGALIVLYEATMLISRFALADKIKEQAAEAAKAG